MARYRERDDLKAYLEILFSLATVSVFAVFAFRPTLLTIAGLIKDIDTKEETLVTMNSKIQDLSKAQNLYDQERKNILLLGTAVPKDPSVDVFARQIEGLFGKRAQSVRLFIEETTILGAQNKKDPEEAESDFPEEAESVSFSVSTSARIDHYSSLSGFLLDFEKLRRPIKIDSLTFSSNRNSEQEMLTLIVQGKFPYLLPLTQKLVQ
jgi:hypothetical protein